MAGPPAPRRADPVVMGRVEQEGQRHLEQVRDFRLGGVSVRSGGMTPTIGVTSNPVTVR